MKEENRSNMDADEENNNDKLLTETNSISQKKPKIMHLNTIKSFSTKKEPLKLRKIQENYNLYDKQIFEPIYYQIHKNVREYTEEIKTGKQFLIPSKKKKREIYQYKYKKDNLLLNNDTKEDFKNKKVLKNSMIKKSFYLKTFSGNINNLYNENNKKRVMFRNLQLNEVINNYNFDDSRLKIKSYTERNRKTDEDKNAIKDEESDIKLDIPEIRKNSKIISRNTENKFISTHSLINLSQVNRTLTNDAPQEKNNYRKKTYYVEYDPKWYIKNKLIKPSFKKEIIANTMLQKKLIDDELILLFDNMKQFQSKFLVNNTLAKDFNKLSHKAKLSINMLLEESTGLFIEISYLLLSNYSTDIEKYISNPISRKKKKSVKKVESEKKEFRINIIDNYESYIFLKVCYETYKIILNNKNDFYFNKKNFEILFQYLDRARFNLSKICSKLKILYQEPNKEDKKLIERCMNIIKKNHMKMDNALNPSNKSNNYSFHFSSKSFSRTRFLKYFNNKYKSQIDCHQKFGMFYSGIDSFNYKGPKKLKLTEQQLMNVRINKAFGGNSRNLKLKHFPKFDINSPLINSLMKYATYKFKNDIISERIRQRFYKVNDDE